MPGTAFRVIPLIQWMSLLSLLWFCPSLNSQIGFFLSSGCWHTNNNWKMIYWQRVTQEAFTFSLSSLALASVKITSDASGSIAACSGRCWATRSWLYKILTRALSHPWYCTEPLSQNKAFLFAPVRWRLMSPSWLFRFHTKSLFCVSSWSKQKRKGQKLSLQHVSAQTLITIGSSKGWRKLRTEENDKVVKSTVFEDSLGICQLWFIWAFLMWGCTQ